MGSQVVILDWADTLGEEQLGKLVEEDDEEKPAIERKRE